MLQHMSYRQLREWQEFERLEPFAEERADFNAAHIVQAVLRTTKPLREFLLPFGDSITTVTVSQSLEYQMTLIDAWVSTQNAIAGTANGN
jgi:hypothetical protein